MQCSIRLRKDYSYHQYSFSDKDGKSLDNSTEKIILIVKLGTTQLTFTCPHSIIGTLEKGVRYVQTQLTFTCLKSTIKDTRKTREKIAIKTTPLTSFWCFYC